MNLKCYLSVVAYSSSCADFYQQPVNTKLDRSLKPPKSVLKTTKPDPSPNVSTVVTTRSKSSHFTKHS